MAHYRKVDVRFWNDGLASRPADLPEKCDPRLAFIFLMTHPQMTALGAMRGTLDGLAAELGYGAEAFREALREAFAKASVKVDEKACFIWLPNFLKYNKPESPNVVKAWSYALDMLPECGLKSLMAKEVKAFTEGLGEAFGEALPEAFVKAMPKAMPIHEQEQEQEQEHKECPLPTLPARLELAEKTPGHFSKPEGAGNGTDSRKAADPPAGEASPRKEADRIADRLAMRATPATPEARKGFCDGLKLEGAIRLRAWAVLAQLLKAPRPGESPAGYLRAGLTVWTPADWAVEQAKAEERDLAPPVAAEPKKLFARLAEKLSFAGAKA